MKRHLQFGANLMSLQAAQQAHRVCVKILVFTVLGRHHPKFNHVLFAPSFDDDGEKDSELFRRLCFASFSQYRPHIGRTKTNKYIE